jgi:hypothetical protein
MHNQRAQVATAPKNMIDGEVVRKTTGTPPIYWVTFDAALSPPR